MRFLYLRKNAQKRKAENTVGVVAEFVIGVEIYVTQM